MKKQIASNSFTVTTVHDGKDGKDGTKTQRRYRSTNSSTYTGTRPTTEDAPTGWSEVGVPTQISATARYRWMIERTSDDGGVSWSDWSPPVIDAYMAQDGTSISIRGQAKGVVEWGSSIPADTTPTNGDVWLYNNSSPDDYEYYEENWSDPGNGSWDGRSADLGDCYLIDGYLWIKARNTAKATLPRWENLGRLQGIDGQNAVTVDLDNESEVMLYDGSENRVSQASTSQATLYDGNNPVPSGVTWSIPNATGVTLKNNGNSTSSAYSGAADCWISNNGKVTVNGLTATDAEITVRAYYKSNYYYSKFTLHKQIGGDKYDLVVSPNAIPYNSTSQEPYQTSVTVSLYKTSIDGTRELSAPPSGYSLCAVRDNESAPFLTNQASSIAFSVFPAATDANNIRVMACKLSNDQIVAGTILDSETIPIARTENGDKGDAAVTYILEPSVTAIPRDHWKTPKTDVLTFVVHKSVGDVQTRLSTQAQWSTEGLTLHYIKNGTEVSVDSEYSGETAPHTSYHDIESLYDGYDGIITWLVKKNGTEKCRIGIGSVDDGAPGQSITGKTGRMCYIAGEYSDDIEYICDSTQTVAVEVPVEGKSETDLYYLALEPAEGKTASNWTWNAAHTQVLSKVKPTDKNQSVWKEGLSNYNLIRTKYLFADFAKLGSAVVSGDWLFSTNGSIDGTEYNSTDVNTPATIGSTGIIAYTAFNGVDPMGAGVRILQGAGQSLYYTSSNSQYFQSFTLVRGRKVHFSATGRSYYSTTNQTSIELYLRTVNANGSYAYTKKATLFSFNYGTAEQEKTSDFTPTETGTYVFRQTNSETPATAPQPPRLSNITAITATEYSFRPAFAVDLLTGKSYMTTGYLRGGTRSPFTYIGEREIFDNGFSDNIAIYSSGGDEHNPSVTYTLPWDVLQSGRRVTITNWKWKDFIPETSGFARCTAPAGKYFFEDGAKKSSILLSREAVELLGFGDESEFYGWIVINRINLMTVSDYGHPQTVIVKGYVQGGTNPTFYGATCFGKKPTITHTATGVYKMTSFGISTGGMDRLMVMTSGKGTVDGKPVAASWTGIGDGIEIQTFTTNGLVDGSFSFMIMDWYDFSSLSPKAD